MSRTVLSALKYKTSAFNSKLKYEKIVTIVHVLQNAQNLVISGCCCVPSITTKGIDNVKIAFAELSRAWNTVEGKRQT